jgi:RNA polymerase sigma factor for flagellar operon FliA
MSKPIPSVPPDNASPPGMTDPVNQQLVARHTAMVRQIAHGMARDLPHSVQVDDLVQDGMMGLMEAILRANKAMTAQQFRSFAAKRIRGAVLDGLRAIDWGTRRVRRAMRDVEIATLKLGHQLGRAPTEGEVANALNMPLAVYQRTLQEAHGYFLISLEDLDGPEGADESGNYLDHCASTNADPLVVLERAAFQEVLVAAILGLPAQEKMVMSLYYETQQTMREIAGLLSLSEGRICQIHTQAIARLRVAILGGETRMPLLAPRRKPR